MTLTPLRIALFLAMLASSLHVAAAPRYWTLTGVQIGGEPVTGYFSYDDATSTVSNWNVHVGSNWFGLTFPPFTFLPGNSSALASHDVRSPVTSIVLVSEFVASKYARRGLVDLDVTRAVDLVVRTPLDGSSPTVPLDPASGLRFAVFGIGLPSVKVTSGSLTLTPVPPPVVVVQVDEFHNPTLGHYFITADSEEKGWFDSGVLAGWSRTGESFKAYAKGSNPSRAVSPVCRFYSPPIRQINDSEYYEGSNSHFFSADAGECMTVAEIGWFAWLMEGDNAFQIELPDKTTGACPAGTIPVYRLSNQPGDGSHRYTTSAAIKAHMLAAGHVAEGYGPEGVAMCAAQ